jgi:hypothetical protein
VRILQTGFVHLLKVKPAGGTPFVVMYFVYIFLPHRLKLLFEKINQQQHGTPPRRALSRRGAAHRHTHTAPHTPQPHGGSEMVVWNLS